MYQGQQVLVWFAFARLRKRDIRIKTTRLFLDGFAAGDFKRRG